MAAENRVQRVDAGVIRRRANGSKMNLRSVKLIPVEQSGKNIRRNTK
jgi:hypothetical protein